MTTSIANSLAGLPFCPVPPQSSFRDGSVCVYQQNSLLLDSRRRRCRLRWNAAVAAASSSVDAVDASGVGDGSDNDKEEEEATAAEVEDRTDGYTWRTKVGTLKEMVIANAVRPATLLIKGGSHYQFAIGVPIAIAILVIAARQILLRRRKQGYHGSVAELVKRGQLRSDRGGISKPLKYEDPFNNPFMKVDKGSSTVEMFGKVYRLAPVTLTTDQRSVHQKRRSRAYQWKRPTVFLKEGDPVPPDVDPDTIRWIPANHPFATTFSDIDESLAQNNVYQKDGVPFRVKAEHEAMQKKLEAFQAEQRSNEVGFNLNGAQDFEKQFGSSVRPQEQPERDLSARQQNGQRNKGIDSADNRSSGSEVN